jgi:hypothetical protein
MAERITDAYGNVAFLPTKRESPCRHMWEPVEQLEYWTVVRCALCGQEDRWRDGP